jgi:hypothetical protein
MASETKQLLDWLCRLDPPEGEICFDDIVLPGVMTVLGKDTIAAESYVEANAVRLWNRLCWSASDMDALGITPIMTVSDRDRRLAMWQQPLAGLPKAKRARLVRSRSRPQVLRKIDSFSDREYETLGCIVAGFAGADRVHLTTRGSDHGVDFFASIRQPGRTHLFAGLGTPMRIIGQAKKYNESVGIDTMREFVHVIQTVCQQSIQVEADVPSWFRSSRGPVVGWVLGHSGFQSGAEQIARNYGIICSDSLDLAEVCAATRVIDEALPPNDRAAELGVKVRQLLADFGG